MLIRNGFLPDLNHAFTFALRAHAAIGCNRIAIAHCADDADPDFWRRRVNVAEHMGKSKDSPGAGNDAGARASHTLLARDSAPLE